MILDSSELHVKVYGRQISDITGAEIYKIVKFNIRSELYFDHRDVYLNQACPLVGLKFNISPASIFTMQLITYNHEKLL